MWGSHSPSSRTIVPSGFRQFLTPQVRWKRSWTRESLIVSQFIWGKHPIAAVSTYVGIALPLLAMTRGEKVRERLYENFGDVEIADEDDDLLKAAEGVGMDLTGGRADWWALVPLAAVSAAAIWRLTPPGIAAHAESGTKVPRSPVIAAATLVAAVVVLVAVIAGAILKERENVADYFLAVGLVALVAEHLGGALGVLGQRLEEGALRVGQRLAVEAGARERRRRAYPSNASGLQAGPARPRRAAARGAP